MNALSRCVPKRGQPSIAVELSRCLEAREGLGDDDHSYGNAVAHLVHGLEQLNLMAYFLDGFHQLLYFLVDDAVANSLFIEPQLDMNYKDHRIILPKGGGVSFAPIQVMRTDIDYNCHVNNANYIRMAMELLPEDFIVKDLRVEYRVAAKLGDVLVPTLFVIENGFIIELAIGNEASAIVEFTSL